MSIPIVTAAPQAATHAPSKNRFTAVFLNGDAGPSLSEKP